MFSNSNLYSFISKIVSASMEIEPYFDKQPKIFMSRFTPNSCLDDEVFEGLSLKGILGVDKIISLEFSINHTFAAENKAIYESDFYRLQHIQIELIKYKRKHQDSEKYDESVSQPQSIFIAKHGYRRHDFFLLVYPFLRFSKLVDLNKHCQHVLIYSEVPFGKKILIKDLKKSVRNFKKFMELSESDNPSDFAYKFFIALNSAYPPNTWASTKTISSIMFQFIFNDTSPLINLIEVDEKNFI